MARPRSFSDEQILKVAREIFLEHGPGISTQVIADQIGISQPALFKRFGTKEDLLIKALSPGVPPFFPLLMNGPDDSPFEAQLTTLLNEMFKWIRKMVPCVSTLKAAGIDNQKLFKDFPEPPPVMVHKQLACWLSIARDKGHFESDNIDVVTTVLLGSMQFQPFLTHLDPTYIPETKREDLLNGLVQIAIKALNITSTKNGGEA